MKRLFKLRGHNASVLCCTTSSTSPDSVFSSSEDGSLRVFDLRTKSCVSSLQISKEEAVTSICLKPGDDNQLYAAAGSVIHCLDLRLGSSGRELQTYNFSTDEINQVAVNHKATYLAAADDSGEIKVIDLSSQKLHKTLRGGHTNICSAVQFHAQRPWEVISGGLDSKIVKWDFSKGRQLTTVQPVLPSGDNPGPMCNPPFVHAMATPYGDCSGEMGRSVAVARGDGAVEIYDSGFDSKKATRVKDTKSKRNHKSSSGGLEDDSANSGIRRRLTVDDGGHLTAVSSVTFAKFGERARFLLSGGNDGLVKLWDWAASQFKDSLSEDNVPLSLNICHKKKINWLTTAANSSANLIVADTSKVLSVYHIC
ncbi:hypothetical protein R1sor_015185 [Riccia sorocarpa]|uniref:WD repeat-containing protein 53 n=1 Tax=Riccia sorocarpa TaxID=122646 RepID=A0ABD3HDE1_9MARC